MCHQFIIDAHLSKPGNLLARRCIHQMLVETEQIVRGVTYFTELCSISPPHQMVRGHY